MAVGPAKFDLNRCNGSPLWGEKSDFGPVSKFNTGSLPLRGNPAGKHHARAYGCNIYVALSANNAAFRAGVGKSLEIFIGYLQ